jgi:hypothetical protein
LAERLGADGRRGQLIVVFSGATVAFQEAIRQVRVLVLDGFKVNLAFSPNADGIFGQTIRNELAGFPHIREVEPGKWLSELIEARAVVCPLLSVNTVSKVAQLIADNLVTNLILHALFTGKPVILAGNGADPSGTGRSKLGFDKGNRALSLAISDRMQTVTDYGCRLTDVHRLGEAVNSILGSEANLNPESTERGPGADRRPLNRRGKVVTAADIRHAHRLGAAIEISSGSVITPLGRELALHLCVPLVANG